MKTIAIIGAGGKTGRAFVKAALATGHTVKAGVHRHNPFDPQEKLEIYRIDATNPHNVAHLVRGADVIVSLLGHTKDSPKRVQTDATKIVIEEMRKHNISRIISLTGTGVRFPGDKISLIDRILNTSIKMIDPNRIEDGIEHANIIKQSQLDWTIVRVLKLTNRALGPFTLSAGGPAKTLVPRRDVAQAILEIIEKDTFLRKAPVISN